MCCLLSKPKVTMTSLCSTADPDYHTSQSKGRYRKRERSILFGLVGVIQDKTMVGYIYSHSEYLQCACFHSFYLSTH